MDDAILYMNDELKLAAFERNWARLETSTTHLDLDALRLCVRLLPQARGSEPREKLRDVLLRHLIDKRDEPEYVYQLAEACTLDRLFAGEFFIEGLIEAGKILEKVICPALKALDVVVAIGMAAIPPPGRAITGGMGKHPRSFLLCIGY